MPVNLYRFEKVDENRLNTIREVAFYYSSPHFFNDLADCRLDIIPIADGSFTGPRLNAAIDFLYGNEDREIKHPLPTKIVRQLIDIVKKSDPSSHKALRDRLRESYLIRELQDAISRGTAVCCFFASEPTDPLMWAFYGDNHQGFCVEYEFDESNEEASKSLQQVTYVNEFPSIGCDELLLTPLSAIKRIVTTKASEWSAEKEFRLISIDALGPNDKGKVLPRPSWLVPKRVICGYRQEMEGRDWTRDDWEARKFEVVNSQMAALAHNLGVSRARVRFRNGRLFVENL